MLFQWSNSLTQVGFPCTSNSRTSLNELKTQWKTLRTTFAVPQGISSKIVKQQQTETEQSVEKCNVVGDALKDTEGGALVRAQSIDNKVFALSANVF